MKMLYVSFILVVKEVNWHNLSVNSPDYTKWHVLGRKYTQKTHELRFGFFNN